MFIRILLGYLIGYLRISVEGYYIERFINICTNQKITIWNIKREKNVKVHLNVRVNDFKEICKIVKKVKCKVKIEKKRGIPFLLYKYKKRKIFGLLLLLLMFIIILSSNFVWNVDIIEENNQNLENIREDLEEVGLKTGKWKSQIDTKDVINKIRLRRNDIAWMGIELKGTNVIVRLVKADEKPEIIDENEYCSIVSDKAGIITKINARTGTANVKVGDTIHEGETLINGWMEGKYTGIRYVHAKGEIEAKVWHSKHKRMDYNTTERIETGNFENKYSIKFNNFKINLHKGVSKFKIYDTIEAESKFKLFSDFYLPISIIKITNKEIEEKQKTYQKDEAINVAVQELEQELNNEIEDLEKVQNKNVSTYEDESGIDVYVTYEVLENIGTNEKIVF